MTRKYKLLHGLEPIIPAVPMLPCATSSAWAIDVSRTSRGRLSISSPRTATRVIARHCSRLESLQTPISCWQVTLCHHPAISAASDQMAYGVLVAAEEYGLSIPQDIALVGFDDDVPSVHTRPALTTVRQPLFEMGQRGIELLLSMLDTPQVPVRGRWTRSTGKGSAVGTDTRMTPSESRPIRIQLPADLIVRASCGANYRISIPAFSEKATL